MVQGALGDDLGDFLGDALGDSLGASVGAQLNGATDFTSTSNWRNSSSAGQTLLNTTWSTVLMLRMNEDPASSGRGIFTQGINGTNGGWQWETRVSNSLRCSAIRADAAQRNTTTTLTLNKDYVFVAELTGGQLYLYNHLSATPLTQISVAGGVLDDASLFTSLGTDSASGDSQNPTDDVTLYGSAHSASTLITTGVGILAYTQACIAAGKVVTYTGCQHLWNVQSSLGTLTDEVGTHHLALVGTPTLVSGVTPDFA